MPRQCQDVKAVSCYAEAYVFEKLKQLAEAKGSSISEELNALMRKHLAELEGTATPKLSRWNIRL